MLGAAKELREAELRRREKREGEKKRDFFSNVISYLVNKMCVNCCKNILRGAYCISRKAML